MFPYFPPEYMNTHALLPFWFKRTSVRLILLNSSMGTTFGCPHRRAFWRQLAVENWQKLVTRLFNIRWIQPVFWAIGTRLQRIVFALREHLTAVDPALP